MGSAPLSSDLSFPGHRAAILAALERLVDIVAQLRHPETGCPWDLAQTPTSLIPYVIEEAYEVVDAIQGGETGAIAEELGDLLLQVVLQHNNTPSARVSSSRCPLLPQSPRVTCCFASTAHVSSGRCHPLTHRLYVWLALLVQHT